MTTVPQLLPELRCYFRHCEDRWVGHACDRESEGKEKRKQRRVAPDEILSMGKSDARFTR